MEFGEVDGVGVRIRHVHVLDVERISLEYLVAFVVCLFYRKDKEPFNSSGAFLSKPFG